ncbi:peptide/nickel transport system substrate-binding protein [Brachybacterium sacelli]|uniref:Peptide/nickel transport system substrate-binding protein n=2 Tax=Brachybacterium sacelli TaxID=173364 RepID=A0ABS4WWC8_9MICO|nr:peptide/nickel transport system substrate-binding protein [Brachybacterium sacelli]
MLGSVGSAATVGLAACSGGQQSEEDRPLRIEAADTTLFQRNFNPYSGTPLQGSSGLIYETLRLSTPMDVRNPEPWLATEFEWNDDGTVLTTTLRDDVTWTDGESFDVEDVVFTFTMLRDVPATNTSALAVVDAVATGSHAVEITFETPTFAQEATVGDLPIVPEHIFSTFQDPSAEQVEHPVGTGPYRLDRFSDQLYTFIRNDEHWMAEQFEVKNLAWPSYTTQTMATALQAGDLDWTSDFIPNIETIFVEHDPEYRGYWYPGNSIVNLTFNLEKELWQDLELRRGISLAIDRQQLADIAMYGYVEVPHPTALPRPTFEEFITEDYRDLEFTVDLDEAEQVLDDAGYERGPDGIRVTPDGTPLSFSLQIPSSYTDWIIATQVLNQQLGQIGIDFIPQGVSFGVWDETLTMGNFDVTISSVVAGHNPWFMYRSMLSSEYAPDEEGAVTANFQRWKDEESDQLLSDYATTEDEVEQQKAVAGLQQIVVEQLPAIPVITGPAWFNYNSRFWTGFPSEDNPYALGQPVITADRTIILQRLTRTENDGGVT